MRQQSSRTVVKGRRRSPYRRLVAYVQLIILLVLGASIGMIGAFVWNVWKVLPRNYDISSYSPIEATRIYSSDGVMLGKVYEENREVVPFRELPKDLINATVAIEDSRFYNHYGVDVRGIGRAVYQNIRGGRMSQGGSTITQQLARNIYLSQKKTLSRKLQEAALAVKIERNYSKDQILELYLNQVFYGSGAYGVETASRVYFGKSVKDDTLAECALLAGLPQRPSNYSPHTNLEDAVGRRNVVLDRMYKLGYISDREMEQAQAERVRLVSRRNRSNRYLAPHFVNFVMKELSSKYGEDLIYRGGLKVYSTLNYQMQKAAEKAVVEGVRRARRMGVNEAALISIDPTTGYVKAMVGGIDYSKSEFNRTVQARRQPGSSFKAFVYTAAVDHGMSPRKRFSNSRFYWPMPGADPWPPKNYDGRYGGTVSIEDAVARSINVVAARVAHEVGINEIIKYARLMGIQSPLTPYPSLCLGSSGVTMLEMVTAYGVFATHGIKAQPTGIVRVLNSEGSVILDNQPYTKPVLSKETASTMDKMFRAVVTRGTGRAAGSVPEARGKTGTTQEDKDAWFIGYVPSKLVTAVWAGNDTPTPMRGAYGGTACVPIWRSFMLPALEIQKKWATPAAQKPKEEKEEPREARRDRPRRPSDTDQADENNAQTDVVRVRVCDETGLLSTRHCPGTHTESFISGFQPTGRCNAHSGTTEPEPSPEPTPEDTESDPPADSNGETL